MPGVQRKVFQPHGAGSWSVGRFAIRAHGDFYLEYPQGAVDKPPCHTVKDPVTDNDGTHSVPSVCYTGPDAFR